MNQKPSQNTPKVHRALYIITVTLLFAIAVVIAITSAANRRQEDPVPGTSDTVSDTESKIESVVDIPDTSAKDTRDEIPQSKPPKETKPAPTDEEPVEKVDTVPEKFLLPVTGILSKGHDTELQVFSETMNDYRVHTGVDIVCAENTPVYAAADGVISQVWNDPLMGTSIAISHSGECYTVYRNLSKEIPSGIAEGAEVKAGQLIASVGNTAMIEIAEEPHLHFEMTVQGKSANPLEYFDEAALTSLNTDSSYES
ncbi:MAG: M23 family metallopeptidase [Clostridia bacterium]|nr:M23 family metallopeptidase [Clostridia bacterium]